MRGRGFTLTSRWMQNVIISGNQGSSVTITLTNRWTLRIVISSNQGSSVAMTLTSRWMPNGATSHPSTFLRAAGIGW